MSVTFISTNSTAINYLQGLLVNITSDIKFKFNIEEISKIEDLQKYDVIVSPANSYGDLSGGIDKIYYNLLGKKEFQKRVIDCIRTNCYGEVHVGDAVVIPIDNAETNPKYMILAPTMVVPTSLQSSRNPYLFMRAAIKYIRKIRDNLLGKKIKVLCPIPCIGVGSMNHKIVAKQIKIAIESMNGYGIIHMINMTDKKEEEKCPYNFIYANLPLQNMKMTNIYMLNDA